METILIVDDEKNYPTILAAILEDEGYESFKSHSGEEALNILEQSEIDLVLTDMRMPGMDGISLLKNIKSRFPDLPVIIMTAHGSIEKAVEAMQQGAYTYILKPFENETLIQHVAKALDLYKVVRENHRLRAMVAEQFSFSKLIGRSQAMQKVYKTIAKVAPSTASVLIEGESGTGKELVARALHFNSPRKDRAFIAVNCAALSENLLESELFGHEKGAFTGAISSKKGRFELADGGTLFLDEIGELSQTTQVKLLRAIQERSIERVGGTKSIEVDFRLMSATNKILKDEVAAGNFREDLYYRLNVIHLKLPPLDQRGNDVLLLAQHFINKHSKDEKGEKIKDFQMSTAFSQALMDYSWPGNIRQLENIIERACLLSSDNILDIESLPQELLEEKEGRTLPLKLKEGPLNENLAYIEKILIKQALKASNNIQAHAAARLGITKSGLHQKIRKYKISI